MEEFGRFSLNGSQKFEEEMTHFFSDLKEQIEKSISPSLYKAIILIGGYGRGEGGVVLSNGKEKAHNNLDFLIISNELMPHQEKQLYERFDKIVRFFCKKIDIGVEFSIIAYKKFIRCGTLVITYDMKKGHKQILGDSSFLRNMSSLKVENIPTWDIRNLMVNRGTLLLINDLILKKENLSLADKKMVIKHCIKAIIGYGDALLFYLGEYDYSYATKQKRMREQKEVSLKFRKLYDAAMNFRFNPDYETYLEKDLNLLVEKVKEELKEIHFECERLCFKKKTMGAKNYLFDALQELFFKDISFKSFAKKVYFFLKPMPEIKEFTLLQKLQYKTLGIKGVLPLVFPYIAFELKQNLFSNIFKEFFKDKTEDKNRMKRDYLDYWKKYVNANFSFEEYGLKKG